MEGKLDEAENILINGLNIEIKNFDLNYNLAYVYEQKEKYSLAFRYYNIALETCNNESLKKEIETILENIKIKEPNVFKEKKKIVFFDKGNDNFILDIVNELSKEYETKKVTVRNLKQIDEWMQWADICWFEWCDELIAYGSKHRLAKHKKIICRLHSYEAFTNYPKNVDWSNVDKVIFVAEYIKDFVVDMFNVDKSKTVVIANGVNVKNYTFKERNAGFNIAYVGYINYKKGPMLLLHTFKAIYDRDNRYKLYIAGEFQDYRYILYFRQMIKELGIENNVFYEGWQDNLDQWLEDKNYILCTSVLESQNMSVMQAMTKGIKPIVHNFVGAKGIYSHNYIWNTIDEAVEMIKSYKYDSCEYRSFIENNYSLEKQIVQIKNLINDLTKKQVTLVYRTYSGSNTIALYKLIPEYIKNKYNVNLIKETNTQEYLERIYYSDLVVTTHGNYLLDKRKLNKKQKVIDLWHGFPIKAIGSEEKNNQYTELSNVWNNIDYVVSYSELFNKVFSKCTGINYNKYIVKGLPRNDFLFNSNGRQNLSKIYNNINIEDKKIIFYMPTFRSTAYGRNDGKQIWGYNIFGMKQFNDAKFDKFLEENNIILILKIHPNEEFKIIKKLNNTKNIMLLRGDMLEKNEIDLYEILNAADLLITDYSSVYFDYLLLDRPIIFTPIDFKEYSETRGFILEPYEKWTPGAKVLTQETLEREIIKSLKDNSYYKLERENIRNIIHRYIDGESSKRIWDIIDKEIL
ncbi:MAG: glycosyltransferase [Clostridium thermopalmarium]|nr:glycosyltransferase [Clostridium thermopalmarium]